jgi:glycerophosphoryl diester phosphodiesterase
VHLHGARCAQSAQDTTRYLSQVILLDPAARVVIGHRGNRAHSPEDTLESMHEAVALGVDALEFDLHVTRDNVPVVHHDATLERMTSGRGALAERSLADLAEIDAGYQFSTDGGRNYPWRGKGVRIPTLDAVLESFPQLPMILEIKTPRATDAVRRTVLRHNAAHRVVVAGFDARSVDPLIGGPMALGASTRDLVRLLPNALFGGHGAPAPFRAACIPPTHKGVPVPIGGYARLMRRRGGVTHVWTVNDPRTATRYWQLGVQGIITDDPAVILAARRG